MCSGSQSAGSIGVPIVHSEQVRVGGRLTLTCLTHLVSTTLKVHRAKFFDRAVPSRSLIGNIRAADVAFSP